MKRNYRGKILAIILAAVMVFGVLPFSSFANEQGVQEVVSINTDSLKTSFSVPIGTEKDALGLPSKLEVQVAEASMATEDVKVNWDGEYQPHKAGEYKLTASFADNKYVYSGKMPSVSVKVIDSEAKKLMSKSSVLNTGDVGNETMINLVDINAITKSLFEVKPQGSSNFQELPLPDDTVLHVGDEVHIKFKYSELKDVTSNNIYYFDIPSGLSAITGQSRGDIMSDDNQPIGEYWIEDGKVMMQFTDEAYLADNDNIISEGYVNFYAVLNQDAVDQDGVIKLGKTVIGRLPIVADDDVTNVNIDKKNGDGTGDGSKLVYDADRNAVQYTFEVNTNDNNKTIDKITVVDTLTTTVNNVEDNSIVAGNYEDIQITPSNAAAFTKGTDGKYVLTANNVAPNQTIKVTYWVPVKDGIVQAKFVNDVAASKTVDGQETAVGGDSVQGNISNSLDISKKASQPKFDPDTAETTVTYTVTVTAPNTNTTAIPNAYVYDEFDVNGAFVTKVDKVSGDGTFGELTTGDNANFKVQLGTMNPGESKTYTYKATLDTNKCYFYNAPGNKWFDNHAYAKAGNITFSNSKASLSFEKQFTDKEGTFDPISGKFRFILTFDGTIPGTNGEYYDSVLKSFSDKITASGATYAGNPAPVLEAMKGNTVEKTATLDGSQINGKQEFELDIPKDMQGEYSYRLTYYVDMPEGMTQSDTVKNEFTATVGVGPGGAPVTFKSETSVSSGSASSNAMSKSVDVEGGTNAIAGNNEYGVTKFYIDITSPIVAGATLTDWTEKVSGAMVDFKMPLDFVKDNMTIKYAGKNLVEGDDYKIEAAGNNDDKFVITFLKAIPGITDTNKLQISYLLQSVASEDGKEMAENPTGEKIGNQKEIYNYARLENGALTTEKEAKVDMGGYIEKKVVDKTGMDVDSNLIGWDIVLTNGYFDAFATGYHPLVDTIPANQEIVKVEQFVDNDNPKECTKDSTDKHGYTVTENEDGTTTVTINAYSGHRNHPQTYRVWTRIKDSALIAENIDPDNFDNVKFTNSAYYETVGTKWNVAADTTISRHNNEKTFKYSGGTEGKGGVEFTLSINKEGLDMDPKKDTITIHDTMNKQLVLDKDSLRINGKTIDQVPGASLTYQEGTSKFDLVLPDNTPCEVTYIANIDAEVGETGWLENTAEIEGRIGTVTTSSLETQRLDLSAGSTSMYSFYIKKSDKDGKLLTGAEFVLKRVELENGQLKETPVETAANHNGESLDLEDGTYKYRGVKKTEDNFNCVYSIEETKAPEGCAKDSEIHYIAFGDNVDPDLKAALEAEGNTIRAAHTGQATNLDTMFNIVNNDAVTSVSVKKVWDDSSNFDNIRPSLITLKLKANGEVVKMQAVTGEGDTWKYTFEGLPTHKTLSDGTREKITYSIEEAAVDGYDAPVVEGSPENGYTITNKHEVPEETSQPFDGKKILIENGQSKAVKAGQFKFTVQEDDNNPNKIAGLPTDEIATDETGSFSLGTLTFSKEGTYKFTVSEVNSGAAGYTYDNKPVTVTVPVTLNRDDNKLVIGNVTYQKVDQTVQGIVFENTYRTPEGAEQKFDGTKSLTEDGQNKAIKAGQFKFAVQEDKNNPEAIEGLPTGEIEVGADGSFSLGTLTFSKAGTYKFTVSEVNSGVAGYTYDDKPVTVTVPVTLDTDTNELKVGTVSYIKDGVAVGGIAFANTYETPGETSLVFSGNKTLTENGQKKEIMAGQFKFEVEEGGNNPTAIGGLPAGEVQVGADGSFGLGTLTFEKEGDYTFTVSEVNSGAAGYTYDNKPVTVTVPVTLDTNTNELKLGTVSYVKDGVAVGGIVFANTYETPEAAEQKFNGIKTLTENGQDKEIAAGQFKFAVQEDKNNPEAIGGLPTGEIEVGADGSFSLGTLTFSKAGTYKFTVSEVNSGAAGYTYDNEPVTVTIPVTLDTDTNELKIGTVSYMKGGVAVDGIAFANTYETPEDAVVKLTGEKILTENGKKIAIKAGQFKFTVKEAEDNPEKITGLATGEIPVKADGTIDLGEMKFSKVGTYKFTVSEKNEGLKNYTYDDKDVTVTVQVRLNTDTNKLEAEQISYHKDGKEVSGIEFENTYKSPASVSGGGKPKTGDNVNIALLILLLLLSAGGMAGAAVFRKRWQ